MHVIRLRGPWQFEPLARYVARSGGYDRLAVDLPDAGKATMPVDWSATCGPDYLGVVRYRRIFHRPTGLEPGDLVWLVVEPPRSCGVVRLNDGLLGRVRYGAVAGRFDITPLLADVNTLEIEVQHPELDDLGGAVSACDLNAPGGLVCEVRLEIEEPEARSREPEA